MATYADLDALAANDPTGHGRLWLHGQARVWSYAGCPLAPADNLRIPSQSVPDARVQAALADGSWVTAVLDTFARPITVLAVMKAPAPGVVYQPITRADLGTSAAA
ncbi:hypothetical protein [Methylobacterium sp. J-077]|uniref:hypothetical protein n=1 Tax=Methylobacterium sp. J-077 TaxID=2836656 RepID=UPI001FBB5619|nr:hypothetical protein [Methylobacterium sp. J-077]MCJ2125109.1 hypothetical protein [Methylobacterium sp. J-077]